MRDLIRTVILTPYRKGLGLPSFTLRVYDMGRLYHGKYNLGYELVQHPSGLRHKGLEQVIFSGEDFGCSPCHAIDSDATMGTILGFLTLRLGDTDRDYFDSYTPIQCEFRDQHAEILSAEVYSRFGEC